jgi:Xaa-Pro aminopeptidase
MVMDYAGRIARVRAAMAQHGIGILYLPFSSDAAWLTGLGFERPGPTVTDRPGDLIAGIYLDARHGPLVIAPRMGGEGVRADASGKPWLREVLILGEPVNYAATLRAALRSMHARGGTVAVPDRARAGTLLALQQALPDMQFISATDTFLAAMRAIKDADELAVMRRVAALTDEVYATILPQLRAGVTEREVAAEIERQGRLRGAETVSFPTAVLYLGGSSRRGHEIPAYSGPTDQPLEMGMGIAFDFGFVLDDYCSDFGRTVFAGEPDAPTRAVYDLVIGAQGAAIAAMRAESQSCAAIDRIARGQIEDAGYGGGFTHRLGHAIGRDCHEWPSLIVGEETTISAGMTFTVEPSVLLLDRAFVRIEDVVHVTPEGGENLMRSPRALTVVGE